MSTVELDELLARADAGFVVAADGAGIVEVATATIDTPLGPLLLAATELGLVHVGFDADASIERLAREVSPRILEVSSRLDGVRRELDAYFSGTVTPFDVPLDLRLVRGAFRRQVVELLPSIPAGETRTYAELAATAGRPTAIRAVGSSCATNPLPIVIPCHRVLRTGGALGGYLGGLERKRWLLDHEHAMSA
ncbi:MAG: methylated-DNA-[]-cysteine S-methyltransferase family protein [Thermoleophilia bacterium]|nr:methylated-DNA-[]-cysteine S-methyltransferase family protein [Thermoleophilia bacterium]